MESLKSCDGPSRFLRNNAGFPKPVKTELKKLLYDASKVQERERAWEGTGVETEVYVIQATDQRRCVLICNVPSIERPHRPQLKLLKRSCRRWMNDHVRHLEREAVGMHFAPSPSKYLQRNIHDGRSEQYQGFEFHFCPFRIGIENFALCICTRFSFWFDEPSLLEVQRSISPAQSQ